jgi:hypothetical protein
MPKKRYRTEIEAAEDVVAEFLKTTRMMRSVEFADLMGWSPQTEASHRSRDNTPPYVKVGSVIYYSFDDVASWIDGVRRGRGKLRVKAEEQAVADLLE